MIAVVQERKEDQGRNAHAKRKHTNVTLFADPSRPILQLATQCLIVSVFRKGWSMYFYILPVYKRTCLGPLCEFHMETIQTEGIHTLYCEYHSVETRQVYVNLQ